MSVKYHYNNKMDSVYGRFKKISNVQQENLPIGYIEINRDIADLWVKDVRNLKHLITTLPQLLALKDSGISNFYHLSSNLNNVYSQSSSSMDRFYRPDCLITDQGLKILEFNIDPGAMMVQTGSGPRDLLINYLKIIKSEDLDIQKVTQCFLADLNFKKYLTQISQNKEILLWDIPRDASSAKLREELITVLSDQGTKVRFISGDEILNFANSENHVIFRMFSYPHLDCNERMLSTYIKALPFNFEHIGIKNLIYDSKINFAHLWRPEVRKYLSDSDNDLIKNYIPETHILNKSIKGHFLTEITQNRENWVLKVINGFQGNNVYLGSEMTLSEWQTTLENKIESESFIIQKNIKQKTIPVKLTNGIQLNEWNGSHLLNLFFVNDVFSGFVFRFNNGTTTKIGAVNLRDTFALPVWISS